MTNMDTVNLESTAGNIISKKSARVFPPVPTKMFATRGTQDPVRDLY